MNKNGRYVVGFSGRNQAIYGDIPEKGPSKWLDPMPLRKALKQREKLHKGRKDTRRIFLLVDVTDAYVAGK